MLVEIQDGRNSMQLSASDCSVIILAGGWSRRYGIDKANVEWNGIKMINHVAGRARSLEGEILAVCRPEQPHEGWMVDRIVFDDAHAPEGPMRGIVAGLAQCQSTWAFALACDAPMIQPALLRGLRGLATDECDVVGSQWNGHIQPLVALYRTSIAPRLLKMLLDGDSSPAHAINRLRSVCMDEMDVSRIDPEGSSFWNINTPEDWAKHAPRTW